MLSLSRMSQKPQPASFLSPIAVSASEAPDPGGVALALVDAFDRTGLAALAMEPFTSATLAANLRFRALLDGSDAERDLKQSLKAAGRDTAAFIWRDARDTPHLVRRLDVDGTAIALIADPLHERTLRLAEFVRRYGITRAESRLLSHLVLGDTLTTAAMRHSLSLTTVKAQLRSLLAKTGAKRQGALISLFFTGLHPDDGVS